MNEKNEYETIQCDVLVIGAGGAGLRAAIEAHDNGAKVIVVTKTLLGKSHTVMAEGGINAALGNLDSEDNWKIHFRDTMLEGQFLSDYRLVEKLVKEVPDRILELEHWGAIFDRTQDGKIDQRFFGAHTFRRAVHTGDRIGLEIIRTLEDQILSRNIEVKQEVFVTSLVTEKNHVIGATAVDLKTGEFLLFRSKAIIMSTGGCGRVFKISTNSLEAIGDGYSLALKVGAELIDMEMIQFHPTGMVYPESVRGMLVTEGVRGEGGILLNAKSERFMSKYDSKRMELSARDIVARAIYKEIEDGRGTPNGGVYLDIAHKGRSYIIKKLPRMVDQFLVYAGIDITKEKMEVAPSAHYTMGGIKINPENCMSSVRGLFAAGEAMGDVHGANRLGGNSLADILVFGRIAGKYAAEYAKGVNLKEVRPKILEKEYKEITKFFNNLSGTNPFKLKAKIQDVMWEHVGIVRNEARLKKALSEIRQLKKDAEKISIKGSLKYNPEWMAAIDVTNMLLVCETIIMSALERKESRGAHYREDYPERDEKNWRVNIVCELVNGDLKISKSDVLEPVGELKEILVTQPIGELE